jgi:dolichyl-phosphate beta-glucosyltransferase
MSTDDFDLTIVIPAFNEERRLPPTLRMLDAFFAARPWRVQVVVVDDGSTDRTTSVAEAEALAAFHCQVVRLGANLGKGAAVTRGVVEARGKFMSFVDADLPYGVEAFSLAMARLAAGADVVIGGRDLPGSTQEVGYTRIRRLSGRLYSVLVNALAVRDIPDTQCGFKCFRAGVARQLFERVTLQGFAFDVELLVIAQCWRLRIERIPVRLSHSHDSRVRLLRDSAQMFWDLLKINRRLARGAYGVAATGDQDRREPLTTRTSSGDSAETVP